MDPISAIGSAGIGATALGSAAKNAGGEIGEQIVGGASRPFQVVWNNIMVLWDKISEKFGWIAVVVLIIWLVIRFGPGLVAGTANELNDQGVNSAEDAVRRAGEEITDVKTGMSGELEKQQQIASGEYQETTIDEYSQDNLGVSIEELSLSESSYKINDPLSAWIHVVASTMPGEKPTHIKIECLLKDPKNPDKLIQGVLSGETDEFNIFDNDELDINCKFKPGDLVEGTNEVITRITYNYNTKAYLKTTFMDYQSLRTVEQNNPDLLSDVDKNPITTNTDGPVALGLGSRSFPIPVGNNEQQPIISLSLTNKWNGKIKKIKSLELVLPDSIQLPNCDSTKPMKKSKEENNFVHYNLTLSGLDTINQNIEKDTNNFVSENIKCNMNIDKAGILSGSSLLYPVSETLFANIEYVYETEKSKYVIVKNDEGFIVRWEANGDIYSDLTKDSQIQCIADYYDGEISTAKYSLTLIQNENDKEITTELKNAIVQPSQKRVTSGIIHFNDADVFGVQPVRGDTILCSMEITPKYSSETIKGARYGTIVNAKPKLDKIKILPNPITPLDDLKCQAFFKDSDDDSISAFYSLKINGIEQKNGEVQCTKSSPENYLCEVTLESPSTEVNNLIYCEMIPNDGLSPGSKATITERVVDAPENYIGTDYSSSQETTSNIEEEPELPDCTETDGGLVSGTKGTSSGLNEYGNPVTLEDTCIEDNEKLKEYYCTGPYVISTELVCDCFNGACS